MAPCCPARALLHAQGVVGAANENLTPSDLLEMAFHAQVGIANREHLSVHRAMRGVANRAPFPRGFVLENVGPALIRVTGETTLVFG